jgi:arsenite methyltransferase
MKNKINYGVDAPNVIKGLIFGAFVISFFYYLLIIYYANNPFVYQISVFSIITISISMLTTAGLMIYSSWYGKLVQADIMLDKIQWRGNENVLDIGCGRGLLTIKAAERLDSGHVVGIDIWSSKDLTGNTQKASEDNIKLANLSDRALIQYGDACGLEFDDESFDVIVSNLTIHNIDSMENRFVALDEMIRVLKPGGYILIQDMFCTQEYFDYFSCLDEVASMTLSGYQWKMFPFSRILIVQKK